jgi:hypothetical protein
MEDDESKPERNYPISTTKMSKTPSWIMLGFLLGAAFVLALPPLRKRPLPVEPAALRAVEPAKPEEPREPPQLTTIEAVFAEWGHHAVWSGDITEVALWNGRDKAFNQFYEVRRVRDVYFFRTIPKLTRRVIERGKPLPNSPLKFTESEEDYAEWDKYGRTERPAERPSRPRPQSSTPPPEPVPIDRSAKVTAPILLPPPIERTLPALEIPAASGAAKK